MQYLFEHTTLGFCWWDLVAVIVLVGIIIFCREKIKKMEDEKKELEAALNGTEAVEAVSTAAADAVGTVTNTET